MSIVEMLFAVHKLPIDVDIEDTASSLNERNIRRWKSRFDFCFHTGSMGVIVSDYAVGDTDLHDGLLLCKYSMLEHHLVIARMLQDTSSDKRLYLR